MESFNNGCPTEILIDLKEDDFMPYVNCKKIYMPLHSLKTKNCLENKENDSSEFELKQEKYQSILDMSPFTLENESREPALNSFATSEQNLDTAADDCPTAVLIDIPNSSVKCPKKQSLQNYDKIDSQQEELLLKNKSLDKDVEGKECNCFKEKKCSATEDYDNPCNFIRMKNELSLPRRRWKTPSPQSMSRISKEASKIIHNLNSSVVLDEDSPLCEEVLPIPINFDNFDLDEDSDRETLIPQTADKLSYHKYSVSIQTEQEEISSEINKLALDFPSSAIKNACISSKHHNFLARSFSEPVDSKINFKKSQDSNKYSITSDELQSPEIQSGSLDSSEIFASNEETNDVFIENSPSEDKENIQERKDEKVLSSKTVIKGKTTQKNYVSKKEMKNRPTLRNLLNVKNSNSRYLPSTNKMNSTSRLNYSCVQNSKELQLHEKQHLKKTTSAEPQRNSKVISHSKSLQYDRRESIFSLQQLNSVKQKPSLLSGYKSSSSDVKNSFNQMKTPSKRYSIATPLQTASAKKSTLTPSLSRIQNPSVPRFTPQSAGRLSFSKSWQQSNSKCFKNQNAIPTSSAVERPSFYGTYSSKSNKQALNQSISYLSSQTSKNNSLSTTSKNRFCSKLNLSSSLHAEQDRKLARALFTSKPRK